MQFGVLIRLEYQHRLVCNDEAIVQCITSPFYKNKRNRFTFEFYIYRYIGNLKQLWLIIDSKNVLNLLDNKYYSVYMMDFG